MLLGLEIKQPSEVLDYDFVYTDWFAGDGDTVVSATVSVQPATMSVTAVVASDDVVKIWCTGGDVDETYLIEVKTTTAAGRVKEDELQISVQEF